MFELENASWWIKTWHGGKPKPANGYLPRFTDTINLLNIWKWGGRGNVNRADWKYRSHIQYFSSRKLSTVGPCLLTCHTAYFEIIILWTEQVHINCRRVPASLGIRLDIQKPNFPCKISIHFFLMKLKWQAHITSRWRLVDSSQVKALAVQVWGTELLRL